jgi:tetratricopeptide (TPR) repeat protein
MDLTRSKIFQALLFCGVGLLIYSNSFHLPFQFDDPVVIVNNQSIHHLPDWAATIKETFRFQASRFLTLITFAVDYYVHRLDVAGYHLVNLLVHLMAGFAVWWLGVLLLKLDVPAGQPEPSLSRRQQKKMGALKKEKLPQDGWRTHIPFLAALLFLAHPVNTEAVTYISQRCESMAALFYVLSVCLYIKGRTAAKKQTTVFFAWAAVCGLAAMLSKETAISLPLAIVLVEWFFFRREKIALAAVGLGVVGLLVVPALFGFDLRMITSAHDSQSHLGDVLTLPTFLLTQLRVFVTFLRLIFVPVGLNLDHDFAMSHSLFEPATFLSFIVLAGLIFGAIQYRRRYPMLSFAVFWFLVTLSSNLIPRAHVIFEHKLYLALTGVIPALGLGLYDAAGNRRPQGIAFAVVLVAFSVLTFERNRVWQSEITLWQDVIRKSPGKARAYLSLGTAYITAGKYDLAVENLTKASAMMAEPQVYVNRGAVYVFKKNDEAALKDFNQAIALNPKFVDAYVNRGELFARRKEYQLAAVDFNKALELDPQNPAGYKMRGRLNDAYRRYDLALEDYNRALVIDPADAQTVAWRGYIYALAGKKDQALADFEEALRLNPNFSDAYVYRGMHRKESGRLTEALADFDKAIELKPSALAYYQRANFRFETKDFAAAMRDVNRALSLDENYDLAYGLRARLSVENKQLKPAMDDLDRSLKINPGYLDGYFNRSLLRQKTGDKEGAAQDLTKAIALNPRAASAYVRRGRIYAALKKYDEAIKDFSDALALNPNASAVYYDRAAAFKEKGDLKKALADGQKAQDMGFPVPEDFLQELQGQK